MHRLYALFAVLLGLALTADASAQVSNQKLAEINRVAMEAYNNLDIDTARTTLEEAVRNAERAGTHGPAIARTYSNLGVVVVGGLGDSAAGVDAFVHALKEDPNVEPDPVVATPEIMAAFGAAKKKVASAPRSAASASPARSGAAPGNLSHQPAAEQLSQTAVPVFVAKSGLQAETVKVFYRSLGMAKPKSAEMKESDEGWSYLIPCGDVFEPTVEYFIVAEDDDGEQVGNAGTPEHPIAVPIVTARTQDAPSLPGQSPPTQCGAGPIEECPPGLPGCSTGTGQPGDTCRSDSDCSSGLSCEDEFCSVSDGESKRDKSAAPKWFLDVGVGVGAVFVGAGKTADHPPSEELVNAALLAEQESPASDPSQAARDLLTQDGWDCDWKSTITPDGPKGEASNCKVAVNKNGFVPVVIMNFAVGRFITPKFALALTGRFQFDRGAGALAGIGLGARAEYLFMDPKAEGFHVGGVLGVAVGTIQAQPPSPNEAAPYATSGAPGLPGALISAGFRSGYRFNRYFGLQFTPALIIGVPRFLTSVDLTAGVEVSY